MLNGLQPWHLIILVIVVVLLFGAKRLPDAARSVGKSMKIFRAETKSMGDSGEGSAQDSGSATAETAEPKQLTESTTDSRATTTDTQAEADKDEQIRQLQKQLDELKQQPSENAQR